LQSETFFVNEDALIRVLEKMQRQEAHRTTIGDALAVLGIFVAMALVLATADFHDIAGVNKGDVHTIAVVIAVIALAGSVFLFYRWARYTWQHRHKKTAEQMVAELKIQARQNDERKRAAERSVGNV
jgi:type VI protein secretion system component VasK